jgi:hypothetical protein
MSWVITPAYLGAAVSDADAQAYLRAVEAADNQGPLEQGVQQAVNQFVIGCKADGIWSAIKASCILAGARTLAGALVPLVGTAPTNVGGLFVSGDYNRETGLVGDGSTKYLNSNRNNNADPQDSKHLSAYVSAKGSTNKPYLASLDDSAGPSALFHRGAGTFLTKINAASITASGGQMANGFCGASRNVSTELNWRFSGGSGVSSLQSQAPNSSSIRVLGYESTSLFGDSRLAFYSIGESLDLALLDARVTTLVNAFAAAIP